MKETNNYFNHNSELRFKVSENYRNTVESSENKTIVAEKKMEPVQNSTGWGQYLGLLPPSVTVTNTKLAVTRMLDPGTVLTFSVSGCRPSKLPLDLPRCPDDNLIMPTPSVINIITTTVFYEKPTAQTNVHLDVGEANVIEQNNGISTETLPTTPTIIVEKVKKS